MIDADGREGVQKLIARAEELLPRQAAASDKATSCREPLPVVLSEISALSVASLAMSAPPMSANKLGGKSMPLTRPASA